MLAGNSFEIAALNSATVDAAGNLLTASSGDLKLDLSQDKINKLFSSSYLIVKSKLNTSRDANGVLLNVKFKASQKMKINVGLLAKLKITTQ